MSIFCIGQSAYDIIVPMKEHIVENKKYRITERYECGGGPALNSGCLCAMWGADTYLVSRLGKDEYGDKLRKILAASGVKQDYLIDQEGFRTPHSFIISNTVSGARTLFNFPGILEQPEYKLPETVPEVILSDGHEREITLEMIRKYPAAVSIIDAGTCRENTLAVARAADYIVCSEDFAEQYTGKKAEINDWSKCEQIFAEVEQINHKNVVITLGSEGLLYKDAGVLKHMPAYKVEAVDTNGAGDIFHGAFAYGIWKGMKFENILKISSMAAAISVQTLGGQTSIPMLERVVEAL